MKNPTLAGWAGIARSTQARGVDTIACGYEGCTIQVQARLSAWFHHLAWMHSVSTAQALELMRERVCAAIDPDEIWPEEEV